MTDIRVIEAGDLGKDFLVNEKILKLMLNIDGVSLVRDEKTGVISVNFPKASVVTSSDEGNLLVSGKDGGSYINDDIIQDTVGRSVAEGLEYDSVLNSLKALVTKLTFNESETISFVDSDAAEGFAMSAGLKISREDRNALEVRKDGVFVPQPEPAKTSHNLNTEEGLFETQVGDSKGTSKVALVTSLFGDKKMGYLLQA